MQKKNLLRLRENEKLVSEKVALDKLIAKFKIKLMPESHFPNS